MASQVVNFAESTSQSQSKTVTVPNLKLLTSATVDTGNVTTSVSGNDITINVSSGSYTRYTTSNYTPSTTASQTLTSSSTSFPSSTSYNDGTYSGTLYQSGSYYLYSGSPSDSKTVSGGSTSQGKAEYYQWNGSSWVYSYSTNVSPYIASSYYYNDGTYSGTLTSTVYDSTGYSQYYTMPSNPSVGTTAMYRSYTNYYHFTGTATKPDDRVYAQGYSGTVYGTTQTTYTYYYSYNVTLNYDIYTPPNPPTITFPTTGAIINTSPTTITWTAGSDADTATNLLQYEIMISVDGGTNWTDIVPLTAQGATSSSYDFLQQSDTANAEIQIRTYDGSMYSAWTTTGTFSIQHKVQIGTLKIEKNGALVIIPIYDPNIGMSGKNQLRIETTSGVGCFELVPTTDATASPLRVKTNSAIMSIAKS